MSTPRDGERYAAYVKVPCKTRFLLVQVLIFYVVLLFLQALYNAYYERELVTMKEDLPGLKLSQYKDRIFENWKKSPENPANQSK